MFSKFVVGLSAFLYMALGSLAAETNAGNLENSKESSSLFSVNPERLFMESGKLFFDSETDGAIPLDSVTYFDDKCYISFAPLTSIDFTLEDGNFQNYGGRIQEQPKKWQCPYCQHWWLLGERCQNKKCPTNQW